MPNRQPYFIFAKSNNLLPSAPTINTIGYPFIELISVDSTNNYAFDKLQENLAAHGMAIFAHKQTGGKGQRGKAWETEPGSNIILSVILDTSSLSISQQFPFSAAMALAAYNFFSYYAGEETKIKWPNDIYWRDRKAGGILIESSIMNRPSLIGSWKWAVVGMGININQTVFPEYLPNPVSLKQIKGKDFDIVTLAKELCHCIEIRFQQLKNGKEEELLALYNHHLYKQKQRVRLKKGNVAFTCTVEGVSDDGQLLVSGAMQDRFVFGEIEWQAWTKKR